MVSVDALIGAAYCVGVVYAMLGVACLWKLVIIMDTASSCKWSTQHGFHGFMALAAISAAIAFWCRNCPFLLQAAFPRSIARL
jgi:hypothetical protein